MDTTGLWFDHNAPWAADLRKELLMFPAGKHDDQVDCLSLIGRGEHVLKTGSLKAVPKEVRPPGALSLDELFEAEDRRRKLLPW